MVFPQPGFDSGKLGGSTTDGGSEITAVDGILVTTAEAIVAPVGIRAGALGFCCVLRTGANASAADHPSGDITI